MVMELPRIQELDCTCMAGLMYVLYVCLLVYVGIVWMLMCMYACMDVCMDGWMYVCNVCMYKCMYACT